MNSFPKYSLEGQQNLDILYSPYNDVTIYVEDETFEHFYTELFSKLLKDIVTIKRVFSLNGKDLVIRHYKDYRDNKVAVKNPVYIIDRDLDPFLGIPFIEDEILIYLKEYCIENYLINKEAFAYPLSWKLRIPYEEVLQKGYYEVWESKVLAPFYDLFIGYLICRKYNLGQNAELSPFIFMENNSFEPNESKIEKYLDEISQEYCVKFSKSICEFDEEYQNLHKDILKRTMTEYQIISGKYLFNSLYKYIQHICKENKRSTKLDEEWFLALLLERLDLDKFLFIKNRIDSLYGNKAS